MNKQNVKRTKHVKRVVCVKWEGDKFAVNKIYTVDLINDTVISQVMEANSAFAWYDYNEQLFRPAYKNDIEVADARYYKKYKILT